MFTAVLPGAQETPPNNPTATGRATLLLSPDEKTARVSLTFTTLSAAQTDAHIHGPAGPGVSAPPVFPLPLGQISEFQIALTPAQVQDLKNGLLYVNVHSANFPAGEIRGQFGPSGSASSVQFNATAYVVNESAASVTIGVTRIGDTANTATIMLFANGIELAAGESASSVMVQLEDGQNHIHQLAVEDVRKVPNFDFSQIIVRLPASITTPGDFRITLTFRGTTGNNPLIRVVQ